MSVPTTLTICGSMRFKKQMQKIAIQLETEHGYNVIQPMYISEEIEKRISEVGKGYLERSCQRKINLSYGIYVVDIDGYIDKSTNREIRYAKYKGKEVIYHSKFNKTR